MTATTSLIAPRTGAGCADPANCERPTQPQISLRFASEAFSAIQRYLARISGPPLDRIDLHGQFLKLAPTGWPSVSCCKDWSLGPFPSGFLPQRAQPALWYRPGAGIRRCRDLQHAVVGCYRSRVEGA